MKTVTLSVLAFFPAGIALAAEAGRREHATVVERAKWPCSIWLTIGG